MTSSESESHIESKIMNIMSVCSDLTDLMCVTADRVDEGTKSVAKL